MRVSRLRLRFRTHDTHSRSAPLPSLTSTRRRRIVDIISFAFRDGAWTPTAMAMRAAHDLSIPPAPWLERLAIELAAAFPEPPSERSEFFRRAIEASLVDAMPELDHALYDWLWNESDDEQRWTIPPRPAPIRTMGERRWPVPELHTPTDLARFLNLDPRHLEWYADVRSLERSADEENLRHYDYRWRTKRRGGARLVEAPKQNLKHLQRRILHEILDLVPPHEAAHGFRAGRSIQTFAAPHTGRRLVLRMDLRSFFTSVPVGRVFATYTSLGYPDAVAHALTGLATNATPDHVLRNGPHRTAADGLAAAMLRGPHLPQGSPTSPALANLAAFGLDVRLSALARRFDATYTRYADDLAVSGDDAFSRSAQRFFALAEDIVRDEGFAVHPKKTRMQRSHQRQVLTGMTVNRHLNLERTELDRLRAQLHEAVHHGPGAANRTGHPNFRAHLEGRIGHVQATNPVRARKLWVMFDRINW